MARHAYFALLLVATLAACSRAAVTERHADEPCVPAANSCTPPSNAVATPAPTEPQVQAEEEEPKEPVMEEGWQAELYRTPLATTYSRELKLVYVEQSFRHEARFLNENLKRDKGLAYQGYFIDALDDWTQPTSIWSDEVKKRVKPMTWTFHADGRIIASKERFLEQEYDVIVLGDINPEEVKWTNSYFAWIDEWVRKGGGVILLCGASHHPVDYVNIEAYRALCPVNLDTLAANDADVDRGVVKYFGRTEQGANSPVLRLSTEAVRDSELWGSELDGKYQPGELHGLYWHLPVTTATDDATVLCRVASPGSEIPSGVPLIVTRDHGEGRVLWLGTDDFHYWRQFVGEHYFYKFWQNCIRWVARDPGK